MQGGIETLPSSALQEILDGRLGAVDLARLESCSSRFRAPSRIAPCESKSIAEAAAHYSCQTHPVFENLPPRARLALLVRCDGHWKQVLYFLECLLRMRGHSATAGARSNVVATASEHSSLIVNGNGKLYITSGTRALSSVYHDIAPEPQSALKLIFSQPTTNCILQISANEGHATFIMTNRTVGLESNNEILKPSLVTDLEMTPCQQVTTGIYFTIALTRSGKLYSWGRNDQGQLGHGHTRDESRPREVIVQSDNGVLDPMVQVSTTSMHVVAVTKAGQLFTWGSGFCGCLGHNNCCNELRPKRVEHGGFVGLFIVCASAGDYFSAAIDSSGLVYRWGGIYLDFSCALELIDNLKAYRAVQVVATYSTIVVLDNGRVHYFGRSYLNLEESGSFIIRCHKIQSIAPGYFHVVMLTMSGTVFGFGRYPEVDVVDPSALLRIQGQSYMNSQLQLFGKDVRLDTVSRPTEVFAVVTKSKGTDRLHDGKERLGAHQP